MYTDNLLHIQRNWSEQALFLMRDILPLMTPVARYTDWTPEEQTTLGMLLAASARSTESTLLLTAYGQLWDAEVTLRSVCEASLKFAFILQSKAEFKNKIHEYAEDQFNISLLKDDKKIRELLEALGNPNTRKWKPLRDRLLSDEEREQLSQRYNRDMRRALDTKWGFTGMIGAFRRSADPLFSGFHGLTHGYSVASHIQHADFQGVSIPMDRDVREPERRDSIHQAHLVRLISDCFSYFITRLSVGYRFIEQDPSPIKDAQLRIDALNTSFGDIYENWIDIEYPT